MPAVLIVPKSDLSNMQAAHLDNRLADPIHRFDQGPITVWYTYPEGVFYAAIGEQTALPIGVLYASADLKSADAGWWIDIDSRGCGYGRPMVEAFADHLKSKGYTGVHDILVTTHRGEYDKQSAALKKIFRERMKHGIFQN